MQIVVEPGYLVVPACYLPFDWKYGGRQQTFETTGAALRWGEGRPFVEARIAQQIIASGEFRRACGHLAGSVRWGTDTVCSVLREAGQKVGHSS